MTDTTTKSGAGRVWADGCYDMSHFGHANSLRQAKALGNYLIVGVHSDEDITRHKGSPPVFSEKERYDMVRAIEWVDQVVESAPYVTTLETLSEYECDVCAHGNDITQTADGTDTYQKVKDAGKYKEVERTQGVSTTELIDRILALVRFEDPNTNDSNNNSVTPINPDPPVKEVSSCLWTGKSPLLFTTGKIQQFCSSHRPIDKTRVVYVAGAFDILHMGHLKFLEKAAALGTHLIVGLHSDENVHNYCGSKYPIMTLYERVLNVLGCRYVQEVVMDAPLVITEELLNSFNVAVVASGKNTSSDSLHEDLYGEARKRNILCEIDSESSLTSRVIVGRIRERRSEYEERNRKKQLKEAISFAALQEKQWQAQ